MSPETVLQPYDATLNDASIPERRAWSERVLGQLRAELGDVARHVFELHAGRNYWGFGLREGLGIGKQLHFYGRAP